MLLQRATHNQQITLPQGDCELGGMVDGPPQNEVTGRSQRHRGDGGRFAIHRLVVGMPALAVLAVAIQIEKTTVERVSHGCLDKCLHE